MDIRIVNVRKEFERYPALHEVSLDIRHGELIALLGPSGSGKTTLLRLTAGLEQPTSGDVFLNGQRATHLPPHRRNIGMVFQRPVLYPHLDVKHNLLFGLPRSPENHRRAQEMAALLGLALLLLGRRVRSA